MALWDQLDDDARQRFAELDAAGSDAAVLRLAEELLREAQARDSQPEEVLARLRITTASYYLPTDPGTLVHYARLRQALDGPVELDDDERHNILWKLKWALTLMLGMPEISVGDIEAAIDDVAEVYAAHGFGARPVWQARAELAEQMSDDQAVRSLVQQWTAERRDSMSDCHACERRGQATLLASLDPSWALEQLAPVIAGELTCSEEPMNSLALAAMIQQSRGDVAEATRLVQEAWRPTRDRRELNSAVAKLLVVLTRLGNVDRAVDGLFPWLAWQRDLHHPWDRLQFGAATALVLDAGLRGGLVPPEIGGRPTAELMAEAIAEAHAIAARFDARAGSTWASDLVKDWTDVTRVAEEPSMAPRRLPDRAAPAAPEDERTIAEHASDLRDAVDAVAPEVDALFAAWQAARERLLPTASAGDDADLAYLERLSSRALPTDEQVMRLEAAESAARRAGDDVEVLRCQAARIALEDEPDLARLEAMSTQLESEAEWMHAGAMWLALAQLRPAPHRVATLLRAATAFERAGHRVRQGLALTEVARALVEEDLGAPEVPEHLAHAEALLSGHPGGLINLADVRWRLAAGSGDLDAAEAILRAALALPDCGGATLSARAHLCDLLIDQGDWPALAEESDVLLDGARRRGDRVLLAVGQRLRGLAHVEQGEFVEGSDLLEAAFPVIRESLPWLTGPAGWALGEALRGLGDWAGARTAYAAAAAAFEGFDRLDDAAHAQLRAGDAAWDADDLDAAAAHFDACVDHARRAAHVGVFVEGSRSRAALRCRRGELTDGIADLEAVPDLTAALMTENERSLGDVNWDALRWSVGRQAAYLLAEEGDFDAAFDRFAHVEATAGNPDDRLAVRAARARFLAIAGRLDEAEPLLSEVLPMLEGDEWQRLRIGAAQAWAIALDQSGRTDEADAIWERFGG